MTPVSERDQRYVAAGLVLWLIAALTLLTGVLQMVGGATGQEDMAIHIVGGLLSALVAAALLFLVARPLR